MYRILRIEPGEGRKVLAFALLGLLLQAGLAMGHNAADSLFLVNVGAAKLPHIYLLTPVMMLLYIPAFSALLARYGIDRVLNLTLGALVLGGIALAVALGRGAPPIGLCYAVKLYTALWYVGLYTLYWNYLDSYFDLMDAKRLFALFAAGSALGAILGGSLVSLLAETLGVENLFLGWALFAAIAIPVAWWTRRAWPKLDADESAEGEEEGGPAWKHAAGALRNLARSRFATVLTLGLFLTLISATFCEYQYLNLFSEGRTESEIAALLGRLTAGVSTFNLFVALFAFNRLVTRFGVRNLAVIQPLAYAAAFVGLGFHRGYYAAVAGFVAYQGLMTTIDFNNINLLFSGLPVEGRKQIRTFIEGLCEPCATATAGFFLLFVAPHLADEQLAQLGMAVALGCLLFILIMRHDYADAIAANLRRDWLDLSRRPSWWATPSEKEATLPTEMLLRALATARGPQREALFAALALRKDPAIVTPMLLLAGEFAPSERRRAEQLIVELGPETVPALVEAAESPRYSVRARSIALRALGKVDFPRLQKVAPPLVERTARKAYEFLGRHAALIAHDAQEPGRAVLARIYRDYPNLALEIVLEALTISGRLPPYEALVVALHGGRSKERGYAIETIEAGAGQKLYALLAPWLDGRPVAAQLAYGRARKLIPAIAEADLLTRSLDSAFPLESAAAWQALWTAGHRDRLAAKLRALPHPLLTETARILEARAAGDHAEFTPVECVQALMVAPEFSIFDFTHLEWLAVHMRVETPPPGTVFTAAAGALDRTWLVLEGRLTGDRTIGVGGVAGTAALHGVRTAKETLVASEGLRVLDVPAEAVLRCAENFAPLGLELLRRRATT